MRTRSTTAAVRRGAAASLVALTLAGGLQACGSDPAEDHEAKAPCGLTARRTGHLTMKTAIDALSRAAAKPMTQRFRLDITQGKDTVTMEGSGDSGADELTSMDLTMSGADGVGMHLIYVDGTIYVAGEGITNPSDKFVPIDPDDKRDPLAAPMKASLEQAGVSERLDAWQAGLLSFNYVGEETLDDGAKTESYELHVDPRLAAIAAGEPVGKGMPPYVTWYVWVDDWNLVHKIQGTVDDAKTVMTFSGFCEPLHIEAPKKEDLLPR